MFHLMALTFVMALVNTMNLSITFISAAVALVMRSEVKAQENNLMHRLKSRYESLLHHALRLRVTVVSAAALLILLCGWLATSLGREFIPQLDEGDIALHALDRKSVV